MDICTTSDIARLLNHWHVEKKGQNLSDGFSKRFSDVQVRLVRDSVVDTDHHIDDWHVTVTSAKTVEYKSRL